MANKQYWHKAWQQSGGQLLHNSGLRVDKAADGVVVACPASLPAWQAFEAAGGVLPHQLPARLQRLLKEAALWRAPDLQRRRGRAMKKTPPA